MIPWYMARANFNPANFDFYGVKFFIQAAHYRVMPQRSIKYVVIHITGGPAVDERGAVNQFLNGPASAHYIVNRAGIIVQMVKEKDVANHVKNIHAIENEESIGIEHVNQWNADNHLHPTPHQYAASALLVKSICSRYGIPIVHSAQPPRAPGIKGHIEVDPHSNHRDCPNPAWNWENYISMVRQSENFASMIANLAAGKF